MKTSDRIWVAVQLVAAVFIAVIWMLVPHRVLPPQPGDIEFPGLCPDSALELLIGEGSGHLDAERCHAAANEKAVWASAILVTGAGASFWLWRTRRSNGMVRGDAALHLGDGQRAS